MATFQDIVGQQLLKEQLRSSIESGKISHAYIIQGENKSGKEFVANVFAQAIVCEKGGANACGECHSCKQAINHNHPDIRYVGHEKPSGIGVDDIRREINDTVHLTPNQGGKKIYIVPEADKMTPAAQNALLKTLEEPPEYVVILLLVSNLDMMLQTILSRCVLLRMKPVSDGEMRTYLMRELKIPDYRADVCIAFARGNVGRAKSLASNEDFDKIRNDALSLLKNIYDMEIVDVMNAIRQIKEHDMDVNDYLDIISVWYRDVLLFKATHDANHLVFRDEINAINRVAKRAEYEGIEDVIKALDKAKSRLASNVNFELTMELLLLTIKEN